MLFHKFAYKMFVLNYEIKNNKIIINFADGGNSIIPYTLENEKKILEKMKTQVINAKNYISKFEKKESNSILWLSICFVCMLLNILLLISKLSNFPSVNISILVSYSIVFLANLGIYKYSKTKLDDINKNLMFLNNSEQINKMVKSNQNILSNIKSNTKNIINTSIKNNKELTLNSIDKIKYKELKKILENIKREIEFNFDYEINKIDNKVLTKKIKS